MKQCHWWHRKLMKSNPNYEFVSVSDVNSCRYDLAEVERGNIKNAFIIMDMCKNSCLSGPTFIKLNHNHEIEQKSICRIIMARTHIQMQNIAMKI